MPWGEVLKVNAQIQIYRTSLSRIRSCNCCDGCFDRSVLALCTHPIWKMTKQKKSKNETEMKIAWYRSSAPSSCRCLSEESFPRQKKKKHGTKPPDCSFTSEKKRHQSVCVQFMCHRCRASPWLENGVADWCWNRPCKSAFYSLPPPPLSFFVSFQMREPFQERITD